jgi:chitodextrinase
LASEDSRPPPRPTGLAKSRATATAIAVSWRPASDGVAVDRYAVYVRGAQVGRTEKTRFVIRGLACGTAYRVAVLALDAAKNRSRRASITASTARCSPSRPPPATGKTLYVSPSGSNSNPGSEDAPVRTIQKAANLVAPGDTVIVKPGVYAGASACGSAEALVCVARGGTARRPVTFRSQVRWAAKLDGRRTVPNGFVFQRDARFVRIEGFEIAHLVSTGTSSHGVDIYNGGANSRIVGNHIYDIGRIETDMTNGQVGVYVQRDDVVIERNYIHDIGRTNDDWTHDHGIYVDGEGEPRGVLIRNNVFAGIEHGWSVHIYPGAVSRVDVLNNSFVGGNPEREYSHVVISETEISNASIRNNVFYGPSRSKPVRLRESAYRDVLIADNMTSGDAITTVAPPEGVKATRNRVSTRPLFMNASRALLPSGLRLRANSPARNHGARLSLVKDDFEGTARPQEAAYEIGAFEYKP